MENENEEVLEVTKQEIRTVSDKTQAIIYVVAGAIAMTVVGYTPLVFDPSLYKIGIGVGGRAQAS